MSTLALTSFPKRQVEVDDSYQHLTFARGYAITSDGETPMELPWDSLNFGNHKLYWDPRLEVARAVEGETDVIIVGHAIHITKNISDLRLIAIRLLQSRKNSRDSFFIELEALSGRYIVIDGQSGDYCLQADAAALRSIYYHEKLSIIASHQNLVAEMSGDKQIGKFGTSEWRTKNKSWGYPGVATHWQGVSFLPANHELHLNTCAAKRVPLIEPVQESTEYIAKQILQLMQSQIACITNEQRPLISLTAGQDSRTTLAAFKNRVNQADYFTYVLKYASRARAVMLDKNDSVKVAKTFGIENHKIIELEGPLENGKLRQVLSRNSPRASNWNVVARYITDLPHDRLHIRSSLNEIGISRYQKEYGHREFNGDLLSEIFTFNRGYTPETSAAFDDYIRNTEIQKVAGYHPLDLFYWEMRMGTWLGTIISESDIAFDTHILINSRMIIRLLLSTPIDERILGNTYHQIVGMTWPELYDLPINGEILSPII